MKVKKVIGFPVMALTVSLVIACSLFNATPSECIEAAEAAGLPDEVIEQLRNPESLNAVERAALQRVLVQAGIDDLCEIGAEQGSGTESRERTTGSVATEMPPTLTKVRMNDSRQSTRDSSNSTSPGDDRPDSYVDGDYAQCLDEIFLRAADDYDAYHWLAAGTWYCRHLEPAPSFTSNPARCNLDQIAITEEQYPEWNELLHYWHAIMTCDTRPTADVSHIGRGSSITPTQYSACLDNAFLAYAGELGNRELVAGISAWLCQDHLPEAPDTHRLRCDLNYLAETEELYPEWSEDLHQWHAIMQCLPHWEPHTRIEGGVYTTCLGDVYVQVNENYNKDAAIAAAVWRCKSHMPEPPTIYNPRCEINQLRREEEIDVEWPQELYAWNAIVQCYPKYRS